MTESPDIEYLYDDADTYQAEIAGKAGMKSLHNISRCQLSHLY